MTTHRAGNPFVLRVAATLTIVGVLGWAVGLSAGIPREAAAQELPSPSEESPMQSAAPTRAELDQLVAPIALYPDELVAQILAAATYPEQIVEADRWMQQHHLTGQQLAQEVDKQPWDPSVKALTGFPSVLANMDKNLSWTSSLGDAYVNHQPDVMNAIQDMRRRAQGAGHLKTTAQTEVTDQGQTIVVEPANPQVVYVPEYDPWAVYGAPVVAWPGWYSYPGLFIAGPDIAFGVGFDVGFFGGFFWGWPHWGCDWDRHNIVFNHNEFVSRGRTFVNRNTFNSRRVGAGRTDGFHGSGFHDGGIRGGAQHGGGGFGGGVHGGGGFGSGVRGGTPAVHASPGRGFQAPRGPTGPRWGAFSGFNHGGITRGESLRGQASLGGVRGGGFQGGGGFHGGGGGFHGGGGSHGGGGGGRR